MVSYCFANTDSVQTHFSLCFFIAFCHSGVGIMECGSLSRGNACCFQTTYGGSVNSVYSRRGTVLCWFEVRCFEAISLPVQLKHKSLQMPVAKYKKLVIMSTMCFKSESLFLF